MKNLLILKGTMLVNIVLFLFLNYGISSNELNHKLNKEINEIACIEEDLCATVNEIDCGFIVTKSICNGNNSYTICLQANMQTGQHTWILNNSTCIQTTFTGPNICFTCTNPTYFSITHRVIDNEQQQLCTGFVGSLCSPDCSALNFNYTNSNCNATFGINPNFTIVGGFNWTFGDGTLAVHTDNLNINHIYQNAGTYNVCVTYAVDGFFYATCCFEVFIPCPECEPDPISWAQCPGQAGEECCIDLTFNSPYNADTYTWDFGDGSGTVITTTKNVAHNFIGDGPFRICVTYTKNNHSYTCCEWVELPPCNCCTDANFNIFIDPDYVSCLKNKYIFDPLCKESGMTVHKWIFGDGTTYIGVHPNEAPPPHIFSNYLNTTGTVTVTHQVICDNVLQDEETKTIAIPAGAYIGFNGETTKMSDILQNLDPDISVYDFITAYSNIPGVPLKIEGTLEVDINVSFVSGTWNMAKDSKIVVDPGNSTSNRRLFGLDGTTIKVAAPNCCRWVGIESHRLTNLVWTGATIMDSWLMLNFIDHVSSFGARVEMEGCTFKHNVDGIRSINHRFIVNKYNNNLLRGCEQCEGTCGCGTGTAIYLEDIAIPGIVFPNGTQRNVITNYDQAVHDVNSNLEIYNFNINYINNFGIWFENNLPTSKLTLDYINFDHLKTAVLEDLKNAQIHTLDAYADAHYTSITTEFVEKGYDINQNVAKIIGNISYNDIKTSTGVENFGIKCNLTSSFDNDLTISHNSIGVSGGTSTLGIALTADVDGNQNAKIDHNVIVNNALDNGAGILVSNWKNTDAYYNSVTTSSQKPGIDFFNSGSSIIHCNTANFGNVGMQLRSSPENMIVENTCFDNTRSVTYTGNCMGTTGSYIAKNTFSNSTLAACLYTAGAITGKQEHSDYNSWTPVKIPSQIVAPIPLVGVNFLWGPTNATRPSIFAPNSTPPTMIVLFGANTIPSYGCSEVCCPGALQLDPDQSANDYNNLLGNSSLFQDLSNAEVSFFQQSMLEEFLKNPNWATNYSNIASFINSHSNDYVGTVVSIRNSIKSYESTVKNQISQLNILINQYTNIANQISALRVQIDQSNDQTAITSLENQISGLTTELNGISQNIASQITINNGLNQNSLSAIETAISLLTTTEQYQLNEKTIYQLIVKSLKGIELTATDKSFIENLAAQCITTAGRSVFDAGNISVKYFDSYHNYSQCYPGFDGPGITEVRTKSEGKININPNPVKDQLTITIDNLEKEINANSIIVYNNLGEKINVEIQHISKNIFKLNVIHLNTGVYYMKIDSKENLEMVKFIVEK